jgi:hypothetical protein
VHCAPLIPQSSGSIAALGCKGLACVGRSLSDVPLVGLQAVATLKSSIDGVVISAAKKAELKDKLAGLVVGTALTLHFWMCLQPH